MKSDKIIYWISTGIMCLIFLFSATMYFMKYEMVKGLFEGFGYPTYIIYPLAVAKILGVIAVLSKKVKVLTEWAYAGFFFDGILAFFAHYFIDDGGYGGAIIVIIATLVSRIFYQRVYLNPTQNG